MGDTQTGWAERRASLGEAGATASPAESAPDDAAALVADVRLEAMAGERHAGDDSSGGALDEPEVSRLDLSLRSAVNDLQHRLLTAEPQTDVHRLALGKLMSAAGADRVCAYRNTDGADDRPAHILYAEAVASPDLSLLETETSAEAYDDVAPGLLDRLAAGQPFASRTEFLPRRTAERLAAQGVDAVLLLPLFVDGGFHGFLRLDKCDHARLWSETETGILVSAAGSISAAIERQRAVARMQQRSQELAALLTTSRSITSSIDYDVVLREVAGAAARALGCPESVVWEYSPKDEMAVYRVLYQQHPRPGAAEALVGSSYAIGDYPGGIEAVRQGVVAQQSLSDADLSAEDRASMLEWGEKTWLSVPLVYGREVLGMMILIESERERRFTDDEVRMAALIGEQAAAALHNARLHRREEDQHRWLAALAAATRVIASRLDRVALLKDVARLATGALLVDGALVYELDASAGRFVPRAAAGAIGPAGGGAEGLAGDAGCAAAVVDAGVDDALRRGAVVLRLRDSETLTPALAAGMDAAGEQTVMWVPFRLGDETLGAMRLVERTQLREFVEGERAFALALGEHAAIALNNARLYAQIEDQATKDGLTGLVNHRHFYDRLAEEFERSRRSGAPLSLLMLDIDDFKRLNDTYGHPVGDEVLRSIGRLMQVDLRRGSDLAARYGGEEFCVILPGTPLVRQPGGEGAEVGATALAERLRRRIADASLPIGPDGAPVRVTVSIGVASRLDDTQSLDELVARADAALYAAKRAGKDRVEAY